MFKLNYNPKQFMYGFNTVPLTDVEAILRDIQRSVLIFGWML